MPKAKDKEDITAISIDIIKRLTGVSILRDDVRNCHRMGSKVLLEFLRAGTCSPIHLILDKSHRQEMSNAGMWINIHMTPLDSRLFYLARRMKKKDAKIFYFVGTTMGALTRVVVDGVSHTVKSEAELQTFTEQPISTFQEKKSLPLMDDSGVSMDTE